MKNRFRRLLFVMTMLMLACAFPARLSAQEWVRLMQDPSVNFYDAQKSFNEYWAGKDLATAKGWKQFKRWEYFMAPRVYPSGIRPRPDQSAQAFAAYKNANAARFSPQRSNANWTPLGPSFWQTVSYNPGIGRVNCVVVDPSNRDVLYIGAPSGGLWKSIDGATTWNTTTDALEVLGVTSVAVDPTNSEIVYIASGDGDAGDTYSIGVLKSTDGGATWNPTGLNFSLTQTRTISKLLIDPNDASVLLAATNNGVYKTTNAGASWTLTQGGNFKDMEFKPGDPTTVYVCGTSFYVSNDGGSSFRFVGAGLPGANQVNRFAIAVSEANPEYVYLVAGNASDSGLQGVYRSMNSGSSFALRANGPNLLGYAKDGSSAGGQSWYDLAIAVAPDNADEIFVGGVNIWKSHDGGASWSINALWFYPDQTVPYVHADVHSLDFYGTTLFAGCDGGIYATNDRGNSWGDLSAGLMTTQFYRISGSPSNADLIFGGTQDNGTNRLQSGVWTHVLGADGMECISDYSNPNTVYAAIQFGGLRKSIDGGNSFEAIDADINEDGDWVTPYVMHPANPKILFAGFRNVWKTIDRGASWFRISNFSRATSLIALAVASSNANYIYAAYPNAIYKTANGGASWSEVSTGLPRASAALTYVVVADDDPNRVWVTFSGFSEGNKVFYSTDGGATWANVSGTLPNLPVNCIAREDDSNEALYIGTDVGVYYRDNSTSDWQPFNDGLPNVIVQELEIHAATRKLRAGTYGRGLWETPLQSAIAVGPKIFLKPRALYFDTLGVNERSDTLRVAITNSGVDPLTISDISLSSSAFVLHEAPNLPLQLSSASELALTFAFTPQSAGAQHDTVRIRTNDPTKPVATIALSGYARALASFSGAVRDSISNAPIRATLEFLRNGESTPQIAHTAANGSYAVLLLEGAYSVTVLPEIPYPEATLTNVKHTALGTAKDILLRAAPIVLVEDDTGSVANKTYRDLLTELGYRYSRWNTFAQGATVPSERLPFLEKPALLLWTTGEQDHGVLSAQDRAVMRGHLDRGGTLLLSGDNIAETSPLNDSLLALYLGVNFNSNYAQQIIRGFNGDAIGNGILTAAPGASKDQLQLAATTRSRVYKTFRYGSSAADSTRIAGVRAEDPIAGWKAAYFGFRLESVSQLHRKTILSRTLDWLKSTTVAVEEKPANKLPRSFRLEQNYPNPFNPQTTIAYELPHAVFVTLKVYNSLGQEVATLAQGKKAPGRYEVQFTATDLPNGVYVYELRAGEFVQAKKLIVLK